MLPGISLVLQSPFLIARTVGVALNVGVVVRLGVAVSNPDDIVGGIVVLGCVDISLVAVVLHPKRNIRNIHESFPRKKDLPFIEQIFILGLSPDVCLRCTQEYNLLNPYTSGITYGAR